jgi:nitronate monooxygenase
LTKIRIAWTAEVRDMGDGSLETPATDLVTEWSHDLRLRAPVLNAPMGGVAGGKLASAVTAAGGLGMIGVGSAGSVEFLEREAAIPRGDGQRFGVGLLDWAIAGEPRLLDAALAASPVLISVSFGDDWAWAGRVRQAGIVAVTQVSTVEEAERAAHSGVDVLVARGAEGGGHGSPAVGTLPLLEGVLDAVSLPVLAAGGISTARGLAAVLAAGASGAWIGTAFAACPESLASDAARSALFAASATDTVTTRVFDIGLGYPWPARFPERVIRSEFWERWAGREVTLQEDREEASRFVAGRALGATHVDAGQGVGGITESHSAADVVGQLRSGAIDLLQNWAPRPRPRMRD